MSKSAYTLQLDTDEAYAVFWHGGRYLSSELLCKAARENDDGPGWVLEFTEPEAWELAEAWESEDSCLSCGAPALNSKISQFIASFV